MNSKYELLLNDSIEVFCVPRMIRKKIAISQL